MSLMTIIRLLPISSADCERMFSLMNRLKSGDRVRMEHDILFDLMIVNRLAPRFRDVTDEELDEWIASWRKSGHCLSFFN
jgi:hypothetical protein